MAKRGQKWCCTLFNVGTSRSEWFGAHRTILIEYTDKKENQIFLIYKKIQNGAVAKSYMVKYLRISSYIRKPFLIFDFAIAPF